MVLSYFAKKFGQEGVGANPPPPPDSEAYVMSIVINHFMCNKGFMHQKDKYKYEVLNS